MDQSVSLARTRWVLGTDPETVGGSAGSDAWLPGRTGRSVGVHSGPRPQAVRQRGTGSAATASAESPTWPTAGSTARSRRQFSDGHHILAPTPRAKPGPLAKGTPGAVAVEPRWSGTCSPRPPAVTASVVPTRIATVDCTVRLPGIRAGDPPVIHDGVQPPRRGPTMPRLDQARTRAALAIHRMASSGSQRGIQPAVPEGDRPPTDERCSANGDQCQWDAEHQNDESHQRGGHPHRTPTITCPGMTALVTGWPPPHPGRPRRTPGQSPVGN